eukprot:Ihof_evm12s22 gene=Ihof_evmTU12s22
MSSIDPSGITYLGNPQIEATVQNEILKCLTCARCNKIVKTPTRCPCPRAQTGCLQCFNDYSRLRTGESPCECKLANLPAGFQCLPPSQKYLDLYNHVLLPCENEKFGCTERIVASKAQEHLAQCPKVQIRCPLGCTRRFFREKTQEHVAECQKLTGECFMCGLPRQIGIASSHVCTQIQPKYLKQCLQETHAKLVGILNPMKGDITMLQRGEQAAKMNLINFRDVCGREVADLKQRALKLETMMEKVEGMVNKVELGATDVLELYRFNTREACESKLRAQQAEKKLSLLEESVGGLLKNFNSQAAFLAKEKEFWQQLAQFLTLHVVPPNNPPINQTGQQTPCPFCSRLMMPGDVMAHALVMHKPKPNDVSTNLINKPAPYPSGPIGVNLTPGSINYQPAPVSATNSNQSSPTLKNLPPNEKNSPGLSNLVNIFEQTQQSGRASYSGPSNISPEPLLGKPLDKQFLDDFRAFKPVNQQQHSTLLSQEQIRLYLQQKRKSRMLQTGNENPSSQTNARLQSLTQQQSAQLLQLRLYSQQQQAIQRQQEQQKKDQQQREQQIQQEQQQQQLKKWSEQQEKVTVSSTPSPTSVTRTSSVLSSHSDNDLFSSLGSIILDTFSTPTAPPIIPVEANVIPEPNQNSTTSSTQAAVLTAQTEEAEGSTPPWQLNAGEIYPVDTACKTVVIKEEPTVKVEPMDTSDSPLPNKADKYPSQPNIDVLFPANRLEKEPEKESEKESDTTTDVILPTLKTINEKVVDRSRKDQSSPTRILPGRELRNHSRQQYSPLTVTLRQAKISHHEEPDSPSENPRAKKRRVKESGESDGSDASLMECCRSMTCPDRSNTNGTMLLCKHGSACQDDGVAYHIDCLRKENPGCPLRFIDVNQWECVKCKTCYVCRASPVSLEAELLMCDECDKCWHGGCLVPAITDIPD